VVEIGGFGRFIALNLGEDGERLVMGEATVVDTTGDALDGMRTVQLRIPARAEFVALARLALSGLADIAALPEELLADLKLALTEAVSNSVRHAYAGGTGFVSVAYELSGDALAIEVVDDGEGFDPERPSPLEGEELTEGGLGIAIIRTIADEFELDSRPGVRGSRLRFAKRLQRVS
jgi:serine/threonine-protein kinase RsbW